MPDRFYLLGTRRGDLREVSVELARELAATVEEHDSSYVGGTYFRLRGGQFQRVTVERNWTDDEGYATEPDFPDHRVLVYLTNPDASTLELITAVPGLERLRLDEVE